MSRLEVGFHTGAFITAYFSFDRAAGWAAQHGIRGLECGFVDGVAWNHGLGYFPHVASWQEPRQIAQELAEKRLTLSQLDAAFPISGCEGPSVAVPYVRNAIRWAYLAGCPMVDTTDGLHRPEGLSDEDAMARMRESYARIMETAEKYAMLVTIETHGYFTANPQALDRMLQFVDSDRLRLTFDTGNVFIAGQDPVQFLEHFAGRISHLHVKDVSRELSERSRGKETGIGLSACAIGEGVNAGNIEACMRLLQRRGYSGAVSLECDAQGGPLLLRSLHWFRTLIEKVGFEHDLGDLAPEAAARGEAR